MPRRTKRRTLARGVYKDGNRIEIRAMVNGVPYSKSLPPDTTAAEAITARKHLKARGETETPRPARHTLAFDVPRYLKLCKHQASYKNKRAILNHWIALFPDRGRHRITPADVQHARVTWLAEKVAPKTINHRIAVLRHLYVTLDGPKAKTPCDEIAPLHVPKTPIRRVSDATILTVDRNLQLREANPPGRPYDGAKTRARFRVLVSTGRRPSEVMRAQPGDVDLENRVWVVRDGKGGWSPGLYLNDDMLAAWTLFVSANAWGKYNTGSFAVALRNAGWPTDIRPYNARHTTWITAVERGADMADVQQGAGHTHLSTTRIYTGIRESRMQRLSETLEGRFAGFPVASDSGDRHKP
jgi:integrase